MADPSTALRTGEIQEPLERQPTLLGQGLAHRCGNGCGPEVEPLTNERNPPTPSKASILGQASFDSAQDRHWVAVGKLTPGLIHEINNTLCVVGNYVQLLMLEREPRGWDILKPLHAMSNTIERAQALTHRVAVYAREAARPWSRFLVNQLLEEALTLACLQRTFRELHLRKAFADNLPEIEGPGR